MKPFNFKPFLVLCLFLVQGTISFAQQNSKGKILGSIADSSSAQPIEYATITVSSKKDKKVVTGSTSDKAGRFTIVGLSEGIYDVLIESIGYQARYYFGVAVDGGSKAIDLKTILLTSSKLTLQEVTIRAPQGLIENKIDKLVFNAEKDLTSQGGVATDVLKKVPQISIDIDGKVELAGSSSIRFLINGKPSAAFGSNIADVLQAIPAAQIKSIEVITNPGAKYDAQGLGGIINIILKQSTVKGTNGNIALSAGTRNENGTLNFNARNNNFGMNAFVSGSERLATNTATTSDRLSNDTATKTNSLLHQEGDYRFNHQRYQAGIGFDWTYLKRNEFSGSLSYSQFSSHGTGTTNQLQQKTVAATGATLSTASNINHNQTQYRYPTIEGNLNYKRSFAQEDQELTIALNSSRGDNSSSFDIDQFSSTGAIKLLGTSSSNPNTYQSTEIKVDYTQPLKKEVLLGVGGKITLSDITSTATAMSFQPATGAYLLNSALSTALNYHQKVYALYGEIGFPIANGLEAKIGTRYERTEIKSFFANAQAQVATPGYNTVVPSIFLSKKLAHDQTIKLSYSKRIERPDPEDLNPFVDVSDPKNLTAGNPYLRPEIGHRIELSYNRSITDIGSLMVSSFYRINDQDIQPYVVYYPSYAVGDTAYTNVAVSTHQNIGAEHNLGINVFVDVKLHSKLGIRSNYFFFRRHTINQLESGYDYNSLNSRLNINLSYQFNKTLSAEFFGNFNSARNEAQGKYPSFTSYNIAVRKQFADKKATLSLTAVNAFTPYVNQLTTLKGTNFQVNSLRKVPFRAISLSFTYKFGKLEFKKQREEGREGMGAAAE